MSSDPAHIRRASIFVLKAAGPNARALKSSQADSHARLDVFVFYGNFFIYQVFHLMQWDALLVAYILMYISSIRLLSYFSFTFPSQDRMEDEKEV